MPMQVTAMVPWLIRSRSAVIRVRTCAARMTVVLWLGIVVSSTCFATSVDPALIKAIAFGENEAKVNAVSTLAASADAAALEFLQALQAGEVQTAGERV